MTLQRFADGRSLVTPYWSHRWCSDYGRGSYLSTRQQARYELRAALRLLCAYLFKVQALIKSVRTFGHWGPERGSLPTEGYDQHSAVLAREFGRFRWKQVERAILGVRRLEGLRLEHLKSQEPFTLEEVEDFKRIGSYIDVALQYLDFEPKRGRFRRWLRHW